MVRVGQLTEPLPLSPGHPLFLLSRSRALDLDPIPFRLAVAGRLRRAPTISADVLRCIRKLSRRSSISSASIYSSLLDAAMLDLTLGLGFRCQHGSAVLLPPGRR